MGKDKEVTGKWRNVRIFKQRKEFPKGSAVQIVEEDGNNLVVRNIKTEFEYKVSKKNFLKHYREV